MYAGILQHLSHVAAPLVIAISNQHAMSVQQAVRLELGILAPNPESGNVARRPTSDLR
jgi:hypothetical protein